VTHGDHASAERRSGSPGIGGAAIKTTTQCWLSLVSAHRVLARFRAGFRGKASPVHFFWGAFDQAVTRFSGRPAPRYAGRVPHCPDWVMVEAYSKEVSSCGYWPGGAEEDAFYSYAYPAPAGFASQPVSPAAAYFDGQLGEFVLPYAAVRSAADPDAYLLDFLESTFRGARHGRLAHRHGQLGQPETPKARQPGEAT
jgi:Family of unknown function (DUF5996)